MGQSEQPLSSLGRRIAELQDQAPAARLDLERGRARLLRIDLPGGAPSSTRARLAAALAAAALLLVALIAVLVVRPRDPLRFDMGTTERGIAGEWIAAPPAAELPIRFSDGSLLRLAPGGRARVASVDADGAEIALERGAIDFSVVHREHTRWTVRIGPFQIHVVGTRFEASWDPVTEQLGVALHEGAITVSGPVVGDARAVRAGERLTVSFAKGTLEVGSILGSSPPAVPAPSLVATGAPLEPSSVPAASVPPPEPAAPRARASVEGSATPPPPPLRDTPDWRALALDARYKEALAAAELAGFDAICGAASASDLRALGDAARLGGSPARAGQAFAALRKRFPGSPEAAAAAFILGRIAQDQSKDYARAAEWFTRYLSEQPQGELADEAMGRLVEAEDKMGDEAGARRAAQRYLAAYPGGSHATYARSVLAREARSAPAP